MTGYIASPNDQSQRLNEVLKEENRLLRTQLETITVILHHSLIFQYCNLVLYADQSFSPRAFPDLCVGVWSVVMGVLRLGALAPNSMCIHVLERLWQYEHPHNMPVLGWHVNQNTPPESTCSGHNSATGRSRVTVLDSLET